MAKYWLYKRTGEIIVLHNVTRKQKRLTWKEVTCGMCHGTASDEIQRMWSSCEWAWLLQP